MPEEPSFPALLRRVRAGDAQAAAELVAAYEPEIRRLVRLQLTDPRLGRLLDSADVCQSVLANFFVRAAAGQFDLERPEQLLKLLAQMARNRLRDHARAQHAGRRDNRRLERRGAEALDAVAGVEATPSRIVAGKELLAKVQGLLSAPERYLADQRALGRGWADLAAELGDNPEALRKRLARALDRVARQLGLEEVSHA
jgi:RNA polymerase sigma-70 factor (ECF subfamily)